MDAKVFQLLNDLIEQRLDEERAAELSELLTSDPEAVAKYLRLVGIHQDLVDMEAPVRPFSVEELRAIKAVEEQFGEMDEMTAPFPGDAQVVRPAPLQAEGPKPQSRLLLWGFSVATAATLLLAVILVSQWMGNRDKVADFEAKQGDNQPPANSIVARVIKKIDCSWEEDRWSVAPSASIMAGQQINLSRGLLVLEFTSGAELTLDGPATLVASSAKSAKLLEGKLSARVPPRGRGFKVETHAGDFVDLGTEFGMIVSKDGAVQTHVFKGKVVAEPALGSEGRQQTVELETGVAWSRPAAGASAKTLAAEPNLFVLPVIPDEGQPRDSPPIDHDLVLWFRASSRIQRDQNGNVSGWGDNVNASNVHAEDAWQVIGDKRPGWIANGIGEEPALRFDGHESLVTEPIHIGPNHTSVAVFRLDRQAGRQLILQRDEFRHLGVQLLNLNGPPHTVLQVNSDGRLEARVHLGWLRDQPDPVDVGYTITDLPLGDGAHVAVYSFDSHDSIAQLFIDGALVAESYNVPPVDSTNSPRYLGSHYDREGFGFTGDIAEILVFDAALPKAEAQQVSEWLSEKYGIAFTTPHESDVVEH